MKKEIKINLLMEYLSLALILSYLFIHNILLVIIGIALSIYLININSLNRIIVSINEKLVSKKRARGLDKHVKEITYNSKNIKSNKEDSKALLVETIEELGYIPSLDKHDDSQAA